MLCTSQRVLDEWLDEGVAESSGDDSSEDSATATTVHRLRAAGGSARQIVGTLSDKQSAEATRILRHRRQGGARRAVTQLFWGQEDVESGASSSESGEEADEGEMDRSTRNFKDIERRMGLQGYLPVLEWVPNLSGQILRSDLVAGVTVGVMAIPQSMSYANIAGLPYIYGLYSACVPALVYAIFGQSRQLAVGPVAMVSLLVSAGLKGEVTEEQCPEWYENLKAADFDVDAVPPQSEVCVQVYCSLCFILAALVGVIMVLGSVFRLSFLVCFLGESVISGFTTAAAITIGLSQAKYFLGVNIPSSEHVNEVIINILGQLNNAKPAPLILGGLWFAFFFICKKIGQKKPSLRMLGPLSPLIGCVVGTLLVVLCPVLRENYDVKYVGDIPKGMFPPSIHDWTSSGNVGQIIKTLWPTAVSASLIGFMESIAIGKTLATKHGYELDAGQEMFAIGLANLVGGALSCYPVTGSFSRSAVSDSTGAVSQGAGFVTGLVMLCTMLFLTSLFYYLPMFVLAAIVVNSVLSLLQYDVAIELFRVAKRDFVLWVIAFIGTLFLGPLHGILIAVLVSLVLVIHESVRPQMSVLWRIPGTDVYRPVKQEQNGAFVPGVLIVRIGASLYFANASFVKEELLAHVADLAKVDEIKYIVLEMTPVVTIDFTALHIIRDTVKDFRNRGIEIAFAMIGGRVDRKMQRADLKQYIGDHWFFPTVPEAVRGCLRHQSFVDAGIGSPQGAFLRDVSSGHYNPRHDYDGVERPAIGSKIGFSNEWHHSCTAVFIELETPLVSDAPSDLAEAFHKCGARVRRAEINGNSHTYLVVDKQRGDKLESNAATQLCHEIQIAMNSIILREHDFRMACRTTASPIDGTPEGLERALARELAIVEEAQGRVRQLRDALAKARE